LWGSWRYASGVIETAAEAGDERLRRIVALTDAALSHLDIEDLFLELLDRVRTLLGADIAGIQLLDQDAQQLVTAAAIGVEDEVRQAYRVDVGTGFAGRVAATKAPLILDTVDSTTVASPILRATGVTSLVGVPMFAAGELVGVLHLGTFQPREFSEQDLELLQLVADRAAMASRAQQSQADRAATLALQRSLLPTRLPVIDGVDMAARYVPGHHLGVGGDWYDVFVLPSGHLGVVVGDVSGHGLRAAVVMGRLRSALRAYALDWDNPADVLTRLDRKIRHFEAGNLATVLYAMISPARDQMRVSLAGHLPPIVAAPGEPARMLKLPVDVPVGVGYSKTRQSATVTLPERGLVVLYTDGLVERRGTTIDAGLRRLRDAVVPGPAETVCSGVMARMGITDAEDDIALLAVQRTS
jgi:serine phosphatase RsbU (regulator of sigma subunit)